MHFIHISVYMSIPIAQFITPPPPSPAAFPPWCPYVCSLHLCLFLPCKPVHLYHFSRFHIYALIYNICFSLSDLTSLCVTDSRSIHVSTNDPISFLFMAEYYSIVYMYHIFFIHSFVCRWAFRWLPRPGYCK